MIDSATKVIINSKGDFTGKSEELKELTKLMNDEEVSLNEHFIWAQKRIKELNQDRRSNVMDYKMKMMDREIYGREIGEKIVKEAERRAGIKKLIATVMSFTVDEDVIFNKVKEQYGEYFLDDEIKQFIVAVKKSISVE